MIVYRLCKGQYKTDLSGKGAELYSGRWNSKGTAMLYTSQSQALALLEILAHVGKESMPEGYFMIAIYLPDDASMLAVALADLPKDWKAVPFANSTQRLGDQFIRDGHSLVLKVPSVFVPGDCNYLVSPKHEQMQGVTVISQDPFKLDPRFTS